MTKRNSVRIAVVGAFAIALAGGVAQSMAITPMEELGKNLFFDTNLSNPPGQPCAAFDRPPGLQVVPGVAFPMDIRSDRPDRTVLLYLSFEHPIRGDAGR
jgi:hypothetical protein